MPSDHLPATPPESRPVERLTLMYSGWQVWDGQYLDDSHLPVRVGHTFDATLEFVQRSPLRLVDGNSRLGVEHIEETWYQAVAKVLDTSDAVVLDFGNFRALRWVRPGESPGDFRTGDVVTLKVSLGLNGWVDTPWTDRAAAAHGALHRWRVEHIARRTIGSNESTPILEASMATVESSEQYVLLTCTLDTAAIG